jgi:hypothetical protein
MARVLSIANLANQVTSSTYVLQCKAWIRKKTQKTLLIK